MASAPQIDQAHQDAAGPDAPVAQPRQPPRRRRPRLPRVLLVVVLLLGAAAAGQGSPVVIEAWPLVVVLLLTVAHVAGRGRTSRTERGQGRRRPPRDHGAAAGDDDVDDVDDVDADGDPEDQPSRVPLPVFVEVSLERSATTRELPVRLTWRADGAESVTVDGVTGLPAQGSTDVQITRTRPVTLLAHRGGESVEFRTAPVRLLGLLEISKVRLPAAPRMSLTASVVLVPAVAPVGRIDELLRGHDVAQRALDMPPRLEDLAALGEALGAPRPPHPPLTDRGPVPRQRKA